MKHTKFFLFASLAALCLVSTFQASGYLQGRFRLPPNLFSVSCASGVYQSPVSPDWIVDAQANPAANYSFIQDAVDVAQAGHNIVVCPGTYLETVTIQNKNPLYILGLGGDHLVILDGQNQRNGFEIQSSKVKIADFTIIHALEAVNFSHSSPQFFKSSFIRNEQGLVGEFSNLEVQDCLFRENGNSSVDGGAIKLVGKTPNPAFLSVKKSSFVDNTASKGGSIFTEGDFFGIYNNAGDVTVSSSGMNVIIEDTEFERDEAENGGSIHLSNGVVFLKNVSIHDSLASDFGGGALMMFLTDAQLEAVDIFNNYSAIRGAAMYLDQLDSDSVINNTRIGHNVSPFGGAVSGTYDPMIPLPQVLFTNTSIDSNAPVNCENNIMWVDGGGNFDSDATCF